MYKDEATTELLHLNITIFFFCIAVSFLFYLHSMWIRETEAVAEMVQEKPSISQYDDISLSGSGIAADDAGNPEFELYCSADQVIAYILQEDPTKVSVRLESSDGSKAETLFNTSDIQEAQSGETKKVKEIMDTVRAYGDKYRKVNVFDHTDGKDHLTAVRFIVNG